MSVGSFCVKKDAPDVLIRYRERFYKNEVLEMYACEILQLAVFLIGNRFEPLV